MEQGNIIYERSHGNALFPFSIWNSAVYSKGLVIYNNSHDDREIVYVEHGRLNFRINFTDYMLREGEAVMINKGEIHKGTSEDSCMVHAITFDLDMLCFQERDLCQTSYLDPLIEEKLMLPHFLTGKAPWEAAVLRSIREIIGRYYLEAPGYELFIKAELYRILATLYETRALVTAEDNVGIQDQVKLERFKATIRYIEKNYSNKIYIKQVANELGLSECYFMKLFKEMTERTPVEYINFYRIRKAEELLHKPGMSIIDVAMSVGFDSVSYFDRLFRTVNGCTPREYQRKVLSR